MKGQKRRVLHLKADGPEIILLRQFLAVFALDNADRATTTEEARVALIKAQCEYEISRQKEAA